MGEVVVMRCCSGRDGFGVVFVALALLAGCSTTSDSGGGSSSPSDTPAPAVEVAEPGPGEDRAAEGEMADAEPDEDAAAEREDRDPEAGEDPAAEHEDPEAGEDPAAEDELPLVEPAEEAGEDDVRVLESAAWDDSICRESNVFYVALWELYPEMADWDYRFHDCRDGYAMASALPDLTLCPGGFPCPEGWQIFHQWMEEAVSWRIIASGRDIDCSGPEGLLTPEMVEACRVLRDY